MQIHYDLIDRDPTPFGELTLHRYRAESGEIGYEIRIDDAFLMASHGALGEVVMATEAYKRLPSPTPKLSALVGGLGAGHTLRAVLDLPDLAAVTVAEIGPKVVEWNRLYFAETNGHAIADPRVNLQIADVMEVLRAANASYHLILLDVDNGPGWLASAGNAHLYTQDGLAVCRRALAPPGILAIWSPNPNPPLEEALRDIFPEVETLVSTDIDPQAGPTDIIYLAKR